MQSNPTHSCMKPQQILEKLKVKTQTNYHGSQNKQQTSLPKLTEKDFININQSLKKIDKVYSAYLCDLQNMKKMNQSKPVVDLSFCSKQYQSMYDFYNVYSKHQKQLGKIVLNKNTTRTVCCWKTIQDAIPILINSYPKITKIESLQSKYSKKIQAETQKLGYKTKKPIDFFMGLEKMLEFYMDQEPKLTKMLDNLKNQNINQYNRLTKYESHKSTAHKYQPYLTEMKQLYYLVHQYKKYLLPNNYFKNSKDPVSVLLKKTLENTKQVIKEQAQAIYENMGHGQKKEIENLDAFFKLHSSYVGFKEKQLKQIIKDKQMYMKQSRNQEQKYVRLYNYQEGCYDILKYMQKQTFQKCSQYLELNKEKKDYTFEEKIVSMVFDQIRKYLNIPKQSSNTLQYLELIHQQFNKRSETVMNGPLYNNKSGIKSNPWLKQEEYNKIKKENQQNKEQLQKYKDKDSNYQKTSKESNDLVNQYQQKFETIKADYDKVLTKLGVPHSSTSDIIRKIQEQTLIIKEHSQAKQFIFKLVKQIMKEQEITKQQTEIHKTGYPPSKLSPKKYTLFQEQPLNLKQNGQLIENWIQNKSYQISDPSTIITDPKSKEFILSTLNQQTKSKIKGFQLLYRKQFEQEQSQSLQQAILGKTNTLLLLKIKKQQTLEPSKIGFFASTSYCGTVQSYNKMSMIMSTKQRKVAKPFDSKLPIHKLEEGNIIIGQNDIRIQANMKMTSNHGKSHAFRMEQQNKFQLFGDDQPEYTLECIEIYKVRFYQEKDQYIVEGQDQSNLEKKESRKQMAEKISELTTREQQLEQKLKTMASEKDKFLEDINSVKQPIKSGSPKINKYDETVKQFESMNNKLSKLKEKAKQLKNISATLIETKQKTKQDIKSAIKPLLTDQILNKVNSQVEQLTSKYNKQKQELQQKIKQLQSENNKKLNNQSLNQIAKLTKENDRLQESNDRYKKTIKKLKSELKPEEAKNFDEDLMLTPEEAKKLRQQLNQAKQKFEKVQEQLKQTQGQLKKTKEQLQKAHTAKGDELDKKTLVQQTKALTKQQSKNEEIQTEPIDQSNIQQPFKEQVSVLKSQLLDQESKLKELNHKQAENSKLIQENKSLTLQIEDLRQIKAEFKEILEKQKTTPQIQTKQDMPKKFSISHQQPITITYTPEQPENTNSEDIVQVREKEQVAQEIKKLEAEEKQLKLEVNTKRNKLASIRSDIAAQQKAIMEKRKQMKKIEENLKELTEKFKKQQQDFKKKTSQMTSAIANLENEKSNHQAEKEKNLTEIQERKTQKQQLDQQIDKGQTTLKQQREALAESEQKNADILEKIRNNQETLDNIEAKLQNKEEAALEQTPSSITETKADVVNHHQEPIISAQMQQKLSALKEQQLKYQKRIKDQQQQITKHQQLIQGLKQQISQYQRDIQEYKTKIKKCESSLEKKQEEIEGLNRQYDNVMDEKEELQQKINSLKHDIKIIVLEEILEEELKKKETLNKTKRIIPGQKNNKNSNPMNQTAYARTQNTPSLTPSKKQQKPDSSANKKVQSPQTKQEQQKKQTTKKAELKSYEFEEQQIMKQMKEFSERKRPSQQTNNNKSP